MGSPGRSLLSIWRSGRAETIQVETPTGGDVKRTSRAGPADGDAGDTPVGFAALNPGKRSLAVDIRTCESADAARAHRRLAGPHAQPTALEAAPARGGGFLVARDPAASARMLHRSLCHAFGRRDGAAAQRRRRARRPRAPLGRVSGRGPGHAGHGLAAHGLSPGPGAGEVRTPGLGFRYRFDGASDSAGAPAPGRDNQALLAALARPVPATPSADRRARGR